MTNVTNGVETMPKISIAWVGRTNVTDRQTTCRRADDDTTRSLKNYERIKLKQENGKQENHRRTVRKSTKLSHGGSLPVVYMYSGKDLQLYGDLVCVFCLSLKVESRLESMNLTGTIVQRRVRMQTQETGENKTVTNKQIKQRCSSFRPKLMTPGRKT